MPANPASGRPQAALRTRRSTLQNRTLPEVFARCSAASADVPSEVTRAIAAFEKAYSPIRSKVEANARRYRGTKFEDCPPMLTAEFRFLVRASDIWAAQERLLRLYGRCTFRWAFVLGWLRKERRAKRRAAQGASNPGMQRTRYARR